MCSEARSFVPGLLSVIIPAYNASGSLARSVESILAQTYRQIELIVVNDGSTDGTERVARQYGSQVDYVQQSNKGETAARNAGIRRARGEFVSFLDHDDYWLPEMAASCIAFLNVNSECDAVSVGSKHNGALTGTYVSPSFLTSHDVPPQPFVIEHFLEFWSAHDHICVGTVVLRHSLIERTGLQREDLVLSGDLEYWTYLALFSKWGFIPNILAVIDGTQAAREGELYKKYYDRYSRCPSMIQWEERIQAHILADNAAAYAPIRGRVATSFIFANIFCGRYGRAFRETIRYRDDLVGRMGKLWRLGLIAGPLTWYPMAWVVQIRIRLQYANTQRSFSQSGGVS